MGGYLGDRNAPKAAGQSGPPWIVLGCCQANSDGVRKDLATYLSSPNVGNESSREPAVLESQSRIKFDASQLGTTTVGTGIKSYLTYSSKALRAPHWTSARLPAAVESFGRFRHNLQVDGAFCAQ